MAEPPVRGRFDGAGVLVTGSTRGIGEEIAKRFAREGAFVVVTGRDVEAGEATVAAIEDNGGEARFVRANLRDQAEIEALIETAVDAHGGLDVLVNNAAVNSDTGAGEATVEDWSLVVETNFRAYWLCAKHAVEHVPPGGSIVNVSSNHALLTMPDHFPYNAVKAGIDGMTRAMALDFGPEIRVNSVNPGWVAVERTVTSMDAESRERLESIHPVGRIGEPADVAGVVTFLASDDAAFVTGSTLVADGGRSAVMQDDTLPDYREARTTFEPSD